MAQKASAGQTAPLAEFVPFPPLLAEYNRSGPVALSAADTFYPVRQKREGCGVVVVGVRVGWGVNGDKGVGWGLMGTKGWGGAGLTVLCAVSHGPIYTYI